MKKYITVFCILLSTTLFAGETFEKEVWAALASHASSIANLATTLQSFKSSVTHTIGKQYRGGIIFYVDENGQHGLIAAKIDVDAEGIQWRNGKAGNKITNAKADGIGAGETNTRLIIAQQTIDNQKGIFAALQAAQFQVMSDGITLCKTPIPQESLCFGDWYLPSAYELQLLHTNLYPTNHSSFAPEYYWSSTEAGVDKAWLKNFATGELITSNKASTIGHVRPIARF